MTDVWQELAGLVLVGAMFVALYWIMKGVALWRSRERRVTWTQGEYEAQRRHAQRQAGRLNRREW